MQTRLASLPTPEAPVLNPATCLNEPVVMDVLPWPNGYGFAGGDNWWRHTLGQTERERLDNLVGLALLDAGICEQLVTKRDPSLLSTFGLSGQTQDWLKSAPASTLKELAQLIVMVSTPRGFKDCGYAEVG